MSEFRCRYYYFDGQNWRCRNITEELNSYDYESYCTNESRCAECPYYRREEKKGWRSLF